MSQGKNQASENAPRPRSLTLFCSSLSMKATDCPWRLPEGEVKGVFMSAWASTQIRHRSGHCLAWPSTEPMARLRGERSGSELVSNHHYSTLPGNTDLYVVPIIKKLLTQFTLAVSRVLSLILHFLTLSTLTVL